MHDDHKRTASQQAGQAVHCLSKISSRLPNIPSRSSKVPYRLFRTLYRSFNEHIEQPHESFHDILGENARSQNFVFRQGSQQGNHSGTILIITWSQDGNQISLRIVEYILRKFDVRRRSALRVRLGIASYNEWLYTVRRTCLR